MPGLKEWHLDYNQRPTSKLTLLDIGSQPLKKTALLGYLYPILLPIYPLLALRQANIAYVNLSATFRALVVTLLFTAILWLLLRWMAKDWHKAGILTAIWMGLFFSYGHVYLLAFGSPFGPQKHTTLLIVFTLAMAVLAFVIIRRKDVRGFARFLNTTSIVLVGLILVQSTAYAYQVSRASETARENRSAVLLPDSVGELPDIYLIILDAHSRSDILQDSYDYDNSDFIASLEDLGFYVATCSQSNYPFTNFSITSMMNMDYFFNLFDEVQALPSLKTSAVRETLHSLGYAAVSFESRALDYFDPEEDILLSRNRKVFEKFNFGAGINEFESMLIETSLLRVFVDLPQLLPETMREDVKGGEYYEHYLQTLFILDELKALPAMPSPKFVMAHILAPHDPYIFSPDGTYDPSKIDDQSLGYGNNARFIDRFVLASLEAIIQRSETPPVIILMGDHGASGNFVPRERMAILNAYYLNEEAREMLYPTITPVNSFRVVFNAYFGAQLDLLEDHSYFVMNTKTENQMLEKKNEVFNRCKP